MFDYVPVFHKSISGGAYPVFQKMSAGVPTVGELDGL